jgi:hypothetical protein
VLPKGVLRDPRTIGRRPNRVLGRCREDPPLRRCKTTALQRFEEGHVGRGDDARVLHGRLQVGRRRVGLGLVEAGPLGVDGDLVSP